MESEQVKASNENVQNTPEVKPQEDTPSTEQAKNQELSSPPIEVDNDDDKEGPLHKPESNEREEPVSSQAGIPASPVEIATQISPPELAEMKSPPTQMMGQPPGYDPNRIPASIFSTKQGNTGDWSATSNESLFSIHMGNNSFSRDYAILFGKSGELPKQEDWNGSQTNPFMMSGELPRLDEWNNSPQLAINHPGKSSEFGNLPPVMEDPLHEESSVQSSEFPKVEDHKKPGKENGVSSGHAISVAVPKKPPLPETNTSSISNPTSLPSPNRFSDDSGHSGSSFAFPVLGSHDSGKNESVKVVPERVEKIEKGDQQPHSQVSKETATGVSRTSWFSCFSCWPRFC